MNPSDPAQSLGDVPRREGEPRFHVERDETFYRWWLDDPKRTENNDKERTVYVARRSGDPVAGAVVTTHRKPSGQQSSSQGSSGRESSSRESNARGSHGAVIEIEDVVPVASETRNPSGRKGTSEAESAVATVIERILADARDADAVVVGVPTDAVSADLRRAFGFVDQTAIHRAFDRVGLAGILPSYVTDPPDPIALRPFGEQFTVGGVAVTDSENWLVTKPEYF